MATRDDVARRAGVSASTVSYVISGRRRISEETKARVLQAMQELNYTPNAFAQGLAGARRGIIALHFPTSGGGYSSTEFEYVTAAVEQARRRGLHLLLWTNPTDDVAGLRSLVSQKLVDGVVLMEASIIDPRFELLRESSTPFVSIGRPSHTEDLSYADNDFEALGEKSIGYLAELGHRCVCYLGLQIEDQHHGYGPAVRTRQALQRAAQAHDVRLHMVSTEHSAAGGREALEAVLELDPPATAVLGFSEFATAGFINEAAVRGLRIPEDLSVVGLGVSQRAAQMISPELTSVSPPIALISHAAINALVDLIDDYPGPIVQELVTPVLTCRQSSGPAPTLSS
ncbi:LacI family DNA-binding transcriptional regulator [Glutamicibacter sp. PS]|uniref:LacI family DNA-binding transcriptional regulator n=1 Tax=Glutamicibacter sp. PS TaxID=3075634 RepID=UPI00283BDDCE|nr:LacI family DNA-binding transcriptional regulator [Glutamicibacter sp. PS]MDR4534030.1 LacI family transcriptional regulator [Glutamicibacter sp. PS]